MKKEELWKNLVRARHMNQSEFLVYRHILIRKIQKNGWETTLDDFERSIDFLHRDEIDQLMLEYLLY